MVTEVGGTGQATGQDKKGCLLKICHLFKQDVTLHTHAMGTYNGTLTGYADGLGIDTSSTQDVNGSQGFHFFKACS